MTTPPSQQSYQLPDQNYVWWDHSRFFTAELVLFVQQDQRRLQEFVFWEYWEQQKAWPVPQSGPVIPRPMGLAWTGTTNKSLIWQGNPPGIPAGGIGVIQYQIPVRVNTPQFLQYTFYDENGVLINLANYVGAYMEVKLQGTIYLTTGATIQDPTSLGQVSYQQYTFTQIGMWNVQFYLIDSVGNKLFGEPIQFTVVGNVEDLSLSQLPVY